MNYFANSDLKSTAEGMMRAVEVLDNRSKGEKIAIVVALFNCVFNHKLKGDYSLPDVLQVADNMRVEARRTKVPEFGGAEKFIIGEL